MARDENQDRRIAVIAFQCDPELLASVDNAAAREGISRSDIARRAVKRALERDEASR
jgi:hypothetical protein